MRRWPLCIVGVFFSFAFAAACGDDDDGGDSAEGTASEADGDTTTEDTPNGTTDDILVDPTDTTTPSAGDVEVTLTVTATDFAFDPVDPVVEVGESSTVHLVNRGSLPHSWVVLRQSASPEQFVESYWSAKTTAAKRDVEEEQSFVRLRPALASLGKPGTFTIDEAGTYEVICDIPGHLEEGMAGTLVVE